MTIEQFNQFKVSANQAKTKYDMCNFMNSMQWKNLPWLMLTCLDKKSIRAEYRIFLFDLNVRTI